MMQLGRTAVVIARSVATKQSSDREALDVLMDCFASLENQTSQLLDEIPAFARLIA